jgi:hypothetical protein
MLAQLERLRDRLRREPPARVALRAQAGLNGSTVELDFWGERVSVDWPELLPQLADGRPTSTFDTAMLLYYLSQADGEIPTGLWISFRDLPGGGSYHQAFQGYSGDRICRAFEADPDALGRSAAVFGGWPLPEIAATAYAFQPLPLIRLAVVLWQGDEEIPSRANVLFDEMASHHLPTDGLALLGAGLAGRLLAHHAG